MTPLSDTLSPSTALVLFSGGQDSSICLAWALSRYKTVETVGFVYGQRHGVEMDARLKVREQLVMEKGPWGAWSERLGADHLIDLAALGEISDTAMTGQAEIAVGKNGLPTTFVPGRNLMFLVMAAALAWRRGADGLVGGMCETDFSGYPDCRQETLTAQMRAINLGMDVDLFLETPLMHLTKAQSWCLAETLGGPSFVDLVRIHSHTCYKGVRDELHPWGYGCADCPACELRAIGWAEYQAASISGAG